MVSRVEEKPLTFEPDKDGTIQLKGGNLDFMRSIDSDIKYWLEINGSVPCFLGTLQ
ncbi:6602_t:CDS:2 [Gigaspora margarita]|uniref:6602_t:CDS:1 n=1 Tax=Gigaspora margarita TaxID=4874 RepID=A0ABN7V3N9_GIGMA|nr:6602_t:CDS:2 [Gigaspora margarita]